MTGRTDRTDGSDTSDRWIGSMDGRIEESTTLGVLKHHVLSSRGSCCKDGTKCEYRSRRILDAVFSGHIYKASIDFDESAAAEAAALARGCPPVLPSVSRKVFASSPSYFTVKHRNWKNVSFTITNRTERSRPLRSRSVDVTFYGSLHEQFPGVNEHRQML